MPKIPLKGCFELQSNYKSIKRNYYLMAVNLVNFTNTSTLVGYCETTTLKSALRNNSNALSRIMVGQTETLRCPSLSPAVPQAFSRTAGSRQCSVVAV